MSSSGPDVPVTQVNEDGTTLNAEWVDLEDTTTADIGLTGWTVAEEAGHKNQVTDIYILTAGGTGRLHTGDGTDSNSNGDICFVNRPRRIIGTTVHRLSRDGSGSR
ncbi:lamin tail domain-containing protein [Halobaculum sp. EA56]|uniref:lamin tail domain-containing protein n=1 Tax=Halobaculum sp. EA56 TaxID=3421648 RepID=UPI003EB86642